MGEIWTIIGGALLGAFVTGFIVQARVAKQVNDRWYTILDVVVERKVITSDQRKRIQTIRKHYWG